MIFFPNCKINLGLGITGKRPDGFHNIESLFYPVNLCDALEIRPSEDGETHFKMSGLDIGATETENNLCMKALRLLQKDFPQIGEVNMHLNKAIPAFAGLGGGSADAAYTLRGLDFVFSLGLSKEDLRRYASMLGSDCIFFTQDKPMYVSGRGEILEEVDFSLAGLYVVLLKPDLRISTAEAYSAVCPKPSKTDYKQLAVSINQNAVSEKRNAVLKNYFADLKNDFEDSLFPKHPILGEIKQLLYDNGALYASLSGSGATVYGIFEKELDLTKIKCPSNAFLWQGELK